MAPLIRGAASLQQGRKGTCSQLTPQRPFPAPRRYELLHQGLYLGFSGLRPISSPAIYELWHSIDLNVTNYDEATLATNGTKGAETLFNLGQLLLAAGQEVAYAGLHNATDPLGGYPGLHYLLANGPGVIHHAYLKSLNLMVGPRAGSGGTGAEPRESAQLKGA